MAKDQEQGIYITQEDIDIALMSADTDETAPLFLNEADIVDPGLEADSQGDDYFGLLSQDDIEALLHGDLDGSSGRKAQDEIDTLFQTTSSGDAPPSAAASAPPEPEGTAQEDVERLMRSANAGREAVPETAKEGGAEAPQENVAVSQDDIDRLLMDALDESGEETVGADGSDVPEAGGTKSGDVLSQDDLDRLLAGALETDETDVASEFSGEASAETEPAFDSTDDMGEIEPEAAPETGGDTESLISQSDLDQLMNGGHDDSPHSAQPGKSEHISQDDINRLLKESLEEAEDVTQEAADAADEDDYQEPVILAAEEPPSEPSLPDSKPAPAERVRKRAGKNRIRGKHLIRASAAVAGIVVLGTLVVIMMPSGSTETTAPRPPAQVPQAQVLTFSLNPTGEQSSAAATLGSGSIHLPGFVVFAPPNTADVTYLSADLTLEVSDVAIISVIKENEAFVRDIIYGTINSELMTRDISAIDEVSLELAIRKALGQIVDRDAISRIAFDRFLLV